jgi:hypothetical protein
MDVPVDGTFTGLFGARLPAGSRAGRAEPRNERHRRVVSPPGKSSPGQFGADRATGTADRATGTADRATGTADRATAAAAAARNAP